MAYSAPPQITPGEFVDENDWNRLVDDIVFLANPPACRLYHSTTQNVANGADTTMTFNSERFDTDSMHSAGSPTRITFNTAGLYVVGGWVSYASDNDFQFYRTQVRLNGATLIGEQTASHTYAGSIGADSLLTLIWKFAAADYIELITTQVNASAGTLASAPEFWATWVGLG